MADTTKSPYSFSDRTLSVSELDSEACMEGSAEPTIRNLLARQRDLLEKLHQALVDLAINLEPIMRDDPRSQDNPPMKTKPSTQAQFIEDLDSNNWQIEKAIGDVMAMQRLSAI